MYLRLPPTELSEYSGLLAKEILKTIAPVTGKLHVSPIFDKDGKAIYPKVLVRCSFCKDEKPRGVRKVKLPEKGYFEFAAEREQALEALRDGEYEVKFADDVLNVVVEGFEEVEREIGGGQKMIVKFNGPAILSVRKGPFGIRFLPLPSFLFSSVTDNKELLREMDELFVEDHSVLHSAGKVWYLYKGKWLPGLSGVVLYHVTSSLKPEVLEVLEEASTFGVGIKRDEGFGDVKLELF